MFMTTQESVKLRCMYECQTIYGPRQLQKVAKRMQEREVDLGMSQKVQSGLCNIHLENLGAGNEPKGA